MDLGGISGMPNSFSEQMLRERELERRREEERRRTEEEEKSMVNRLMLARMNTLEEGFREVLREIKTMSTANSSKVGSEADTVQGTTPRGMRTPSRKHRHNAKSATTIEHHHHGMTARDMADEAAMPDHDDDINQRSEGPGVEGPANPSCKTETKREGCEDVVITRSAT